MKVCEVCGREIGGRDGDNMCAACEALQDERQVRNRRRSRARREREAMLRSFGLVKVTGALGGTYWE